MGKLATLTLSAISIGFSSPKKNRVGSLHPTRFFLGEENPIDMADNVRVANLPIYLYNSPQLSRRSFSYMEQNNVPLGQGGLRESNPPSEHNHSLNMETLLN